MKQRTESVIWKIRQHKIPNQNSKKKKFPPNEDTLRDLVNHIMCTNIHFIKVLEGKEREQGIENIFEEIMMKIFSNLEKKINIKAQEAPRVPKKMNPKWFTPRHIIIKLAMVKDKERILKAAREKQLSYLKGNTHKTVSCFLSRNLGQKGLA